MADGTITIETDLDTSGAEKGVNTLKSKIGSGFKTMGATAVKGVAAVTGALIAMGGKCVDIASDLTEVQNVVDTTFGDSAGTINQWAKDASKSFGLTELQAKQFTGTLGAMMKSSGITGESLNTMSMDLAGLSADFASFYNLSHEEAFEKIKSGISGETEPLKALGINMSVANMEAYALSKGINKSYNEMTQAEQTTLRYNYIMEQGKDASGDFAKTLDTSLANQLRVAKNEITSLCGEIGQNLLPSVLNGTKVIREEIGKISDAFKTGGFNGMAEQIGASIGTLLTKITEQLPNIVNMGVTILQSLINGIQQNLPTITNSALQIVTSLTTGLLQMLPQLLQMGIDIICQLAAGIGQQAPTLIPLIAECLMNLLSTWYMNVPNFIDAGMKLLDGVITGIIEAIPKLIETVPKLVTEFINNLVSNFPKFMEQGTNIQLKLIDGIVNTIPKLVDAIPKIISGFINGIVPHLPKIIESGMLMIGKLVVGLIKAIPQLIGAIPQITNAIFQGFAQVDWAQIGVNIVKGIWNGIKSLAGWLGSKVSGFAGGIVNSFKSKLGIHSPSRVNALPTYIEIYSV